MKHLDDIYNEIILTEKLRRIKLDPKSVRQELDKQYGSISQQETNVSYKIRQNEEKEVIEILKVLYHFDQMYTDAFLRFKDNPKQLTQTLFNIEQSWKMFNEGTLQQYLRQASKLVFINLLHLMGLNNVAISYNEEGRPVYQLHLLHKFIQMNILQELLKTKKIDEKTAKELEAIIFDPQTQESLKNEIKKYYRDTARTPDIKEIQDTPPKEVSDVEPFNPRPAQEDRIAMIRRLMQK